MDSQNITHGEPLAVKQSEVMKQVFELMEFVNEGYDPEAGEFTVFDFAKAHNISPEYARRKLSALCEKGKLDRELRRVNDRQTYVYFKAKT